MTTRLKNKLLKEMRHEMNILKGKFTKKCSTSLCFSTQNKKELKEHFSDKYNAELARKYDYLLGQHYVFFHELRDNYFSVSVYFPRHFETYDDLKENTSIHVRIDKKYNDGASKDVDFANISYAEFKLFLNDYFFINDLFNEYDILSWSQESPNRHMINLFKKLWFTERESVVSFIEQIRDNESKIREILANKNNFIQKRREINRAKKNAKKKNKRTINTRILENEKEIMLLKQKIRALEKENEKIKRGESITSNNNYNQQVILENKYKQSLDEFLHDNYHKIIQRSNFYDTYAIMLFK